MKDIQNLQVIEQDNITVDVLMQSPLKFQSLTGNIGFKNLIKDKNVSRPQLALAGYVSIFTYERVQIFGNTEIHYLNTLTIEEKIKRFSTLAEFSVPCIIITNNNTLDKELIEIAKKQNIAILTTSHETTKTTSLLSEFLDDQFAPQVVVHGSFVDVYGVGILFVGKSGIGKSEIALDLVERGHRIVADDIVMLTKKGETILMGTGTSMVQHFMEIRGLGIIDIRQMFGIRSIRFQKRLEIVVELEDWNSEIEYTRTGLDEEPIKIMEVEVQYVKLPIFPGKNVTVIAEVIALNYLLRTYGYNAAKVLTDKLTEAIQKKSSAESAFQDQRLISYFQSDNE
jgi:HPr kinase/phosphorylase